FTIISIIFGGFAWGIPGMFLSVPILGILKVVSENIPPLKPIAYILSFKNNKQPDSPNEPASTSLRLHYGFPHKKHHRILSRLLPFPKSGRRKWGGKNAKTPRPHL